MRDNKLDIYRGLIMMYIIGFIHTLYWLPNFGKYKSLFLFEMSIIFFISGVSYSLSSKKKYLDYIKTRIVRIVIPYYGFILFVCFISYIYYLSGNNILDTEIDKFIIGSINIFNKPNVNLRFLTWHLWFIPVYFIIMFFIPVMYRVYEVLEKEMKLMPLFIIFCMVIIFTNNVEITDFNKNILFYIFWVYLGFFYKYFEDNPINKKINITFSVLIIILLFYLISRKDILLDMQKNKFPPNITFMIYNIAIFSILYYFRNNIIYLKNVPILSKLIDIYSKYGFTLYLYQPFSYLIFSGLYYKLFEINDTFLYKLILVLFSSISIVLINIIFIFPFSKLESIRIWRKK